MLPRTRSKEFVRVFGPSAFAFCGRFRQRFRVQVRRRLFVFFLRDHFLHDHFGRPFGSTAHSVRELFTSTIDPQGPEEAVENELTVLRAY